MGYTALYTSLRGKSNMDQKALTAKLRELRAQLAAKSDTDPQTLVLLEEVTADLDRLHDESQPSTQEEVDSEPHSRASHKLLQAKKMSI